MNHLTLQRIAGQLAHVQGYLEGVQNLFELAKDLNIELKPLDLSNPIQAIEQVLEELKKEHNEPRHTK